MSKTLFVSNLNYRATDDNLRDLFEFYGQIETATVVLDKETGQSKGFGFVKMVNEVEADTAMNELHKMEYMGRMINVNVAHDKKRKSTE